MVSVRMAVIYGSGGMLYAILGIAFAATRTGPAPFIALLALWPALAHWTLAWFHLFDAEGGARFLGKDSGANGKGMFPWSKAAYLFPALLSTWAVWLFRHLFLTPFQENPYDRVATDIYVGRWPLWYPSEFPVSCKNVVDLTAEFPARRCVISDRQYRCIPSLDADSPNPEVMLRTAKEVVAWGGGVYVHCVRRKHMANGHGRSACFAALVMLHRGDAGTWREAFSLMRQSRPLIGIQQQQEDVMDRLEQQWRREAGLRPNPAIEDKGARKPSFEMAPVASAPLYDNPMRDGHDRNGIS